MEKITVLDTTVSYCSCKDEDYISLSDMARHRDAARVDYIIQNWIRNRNTIEFLGLWEQLNNPDFNSIGFDGIKQQAGLNSFSLTPKLWIEKTAAVGLVSKTGRYGGTFAHKDIAFEFASWLSVTFKLYLIKEFQRLKDDEQRHLGWYIKHNLATIRNHVKNGYLVPEQVTPAQINMEYASEADIINLALFGQTAAEWRKKNRKKDGNIRDDASAAQLVCLSSLESLNTLFVREGLPQAERLARLNAFAIHQMTLLGKAATAE